MGGESVDEGEELGGEKGGGSAKMGCGEGSIGIESGVSRNERKDMSSTEKCNEEGHDSSKVTSQKMHI
jgi:hypothetical protein